MGSLSVSSHSNSGSVAEKKPQPHEILKVLGTIGPKNAKKTSLYIVSKKDGLETVGKLSNGRYVVAGTKKEMKGVQIVTSKAKDILNNLSETFTKKKVLNEGPGNSIPEAWLGARTVYIVGKKSERGYGIFRSILIKLISLFIRIPNLDSAYADLSKKFTRQTIQGIEEAKGESLEGLMVDKGKLISFISKVGTESDVASIFTALKDKLVKYNKNEEDLFLDGDSFAEELEKELAALFLREALQFKRYNLVKYFYENYQPNIELETLEHIAIKQDVKAAMILKVNENPLWKAYLLRNSMEHGTLGSKKMLDFLKPSDSLIQILMKA